MTRVNQQAAVLARQQVPPVHQWQVGRAMTAEALQQILRAAVTPGVMPAVIGTKFPDVWVMWYGAPVPPEKP